MEAITDARIIFGRQRARRRTVFWLLSLATLSLMAINLRVGTAGYSAAEIFRALLSFSDQGDIGFVVWRLRLPRTLATVMGGAYLAAAGLLLQVYFRNPIVEPFILGISSGATLAVSLVMLTTAGIKLSLVTPFLITLAGCAGGLIVMILVAALAARVRSGTTLLVMGLMIGYVCSSGTSVVTALAEREKVKAFVLWGLGSFAGLRWTEILIMAGLGGILTASVAILARPLNAFLLGEDYAASMGVSVRRFRLYILLTASSLAGLVTAMAGPVAFIGLAVPHIARLTLGTSDNRVLVPCVCLTGAAVTTLCDMIARMWLSPVELPVSAITAFFGAPIVITLLLGRGG
ncbi:MAG: iron ABC transporter permease, partial [Deltaproteobacteria bacterium]|nr:iron ABC transporter permease [Deltaproteobacteria bacterium]